MLTSLWTLQSCSSMDDADAAPERDNSDKAIKEVLARNCIRLPGGEDPSIGLDSLSSDTLKVFPDDIGYHKLLMQSLVSAQGMVTIIARSIDISVFGGSNNSWMNYYEPYLGVYSSFNDSRSKQWNLEKDITYEGRVWDYHLSILDLPEGVSSDNNAVRAVEVFYDSDFNHGVMTFSPTDFDAVRFPKKIFGPDIRGVLTFVNDGSTTTNELYLTNIGVNNNVKYIRNICLRTESTNGCMAIMAMIDFPALWFDVKENSGFTVSAIGAYDENTGGAVMYSGIVRNSSNEKSVSALVLEHPSDEVLAHYYPLWSKMMENNKNNSSIDQTSDNNETETGGGNIGTGSVVMSLGSKESEVATEEEYGKPGYYIQGDYKPIAEVTDKTPFLKALNKCLDMMDDGNFPISPYKNSVNQVEWASAEKSR